MITAKQRKERSENKLLQMGVPVNTYLPIINVQETKIQSPQAVAKRCLILLALLNVVHGNKQKEIVRWLKQYKLWNDASPEEQAFFNAAYPDEVLRNELSWRIEALWVLLWALGLASELGLPVEPCNLEDPELFKKIPGLGRDPSRFIQEATLRSGDELLDELDLIYRVHWAVRDAALNDREILCGFHHGIVYEWHYALNWLTGYAEQWDDIF
jgi:hypothetical protein